MGVRAVVISDADTGRTDRVVESCMAVRARASQLVVVLVCMALRSFMEYFHTALHELKVVPDTCAVDETKYMPAP